jgi:hypothetical protein
LQNAPFCPIPASGSNFNPQNTQCIRACPVKCEAHFSGVVKIFAFLGLEPQLNIEYRFNWAGKIERFSKVSFIGLPRGVKGAFVLDDLLKFGTFHRL